MASMTGWYLVLILVTGQVTVNRAPMTEQSCQAQLHFAETSGAKGACVDIE